MRLPSRGTFEIVSLIVYVRNGDLIKHYEVLHSRVLHDIQEHDHMQ